MYINIFYTKDFTIIFHLYALFINFIIQSFFFSFKTISTRQTLAKDPDIVISGLSTKKTLEIFCSI